MLSNQNLLSSITIKEGVLKNIDGSGDIEKVTESVIGILDNLK